MEQRKLLEDIKGRVVNNNGTWDLTGDNGEPLVYDEEKNVAITDLIINGDDMACAVIPLEHFSREILNRILITM